MGKNDFVTGTATTKQFFDWINERHSIWCRRRNGQKKPWTKDAIFMDWKFTNVFRQLDTGTIVLQRTISGECNQDLSGDKIIKIPVTSCKEKLLLNSYDYPLVEGRSVCLSNTGYPVIRIDQKTWPIHWYIINRNTKGPEDTDHRDRNKFNNARKNLRRITHSQNAQSCSYNNSQMVYDDHDGLWRGKFKMHNKYTFGTYHKNREDALLEIKKLYANSDRCTPDSIDKKLVAANIMVYRLFNLDTHAKEYGFIYDLDDYLNWLHDKHSLGKKIFTSAHLTTGVAFEDKIDTYSRAAKIAWEMAPKIVNACKSNRMQIVFEELLNGYLIGKFVAYEIACDLRFTPLFSETPEDVLTWANMGGGAQRGLQRLGMPAFNKDVGLKSMVCLWAESEEFLQDHVKKHKELPLSARAVEYPPFELREIEHSLCEFDKYERIRLNQGRPRQKYDGR